MSKGLRLLAAIGLLGFAGLLGHTPTARADIVSYWSFDSKEADSVADGAPDSPHGGTLVNGADLTTGGLGYGGGEALRADADGQSGPQGYLDVGSPTTYDFNSDFTWHARVKIGMAAGRFGLISRAPADTSYNEGSKTLYLENGAIKFDAAGVGTIAPAGSIADGTWHQIIVTFSATHVPSIGDDDGTGRLTIFVDGSPISMGNFNANQYDEHHWEDNGGLAESGFRIGAGSEDLLANSFTGLIDEVAIFNEELIGTDLSQLKNLGPASFLPPVLIWNGTNNNWAATAGGSSHWTGGSPGMLPDASTPVVVPSGAIQVKDNRTARQLRIDAGSVRIEMTGNLDIERNVYVGPLGTLHVEGSLFAQSLTNAGTTVLDLSAVAMINDVRLVGGSIDTYTPLFVNTLAIEGGNLYSNGSNITVNTRLSTAVDGQNVAADFKVRGVLDIVDGPGVLQLDGSLAMKSGSQYDVELAGAILDRIEATGNVTLDENTSLNLVIDGLHPFQAGPHVLIQTTGSSSLAGTFGSVTDLGDYVTGSGLTYEGQSATLTLDFGLLAGDATLDTVTDVRDFNVWNTNKFTSGTDWIAGDFDGNGVTDVRDFNIWNTNKFTSVGFAAPVPAGPVSEPTTLMLLAAVALFCVAWRISGRR